ncbi:prepilin-type N-terminal cleavage/methylation domain-containing protein [Candidatus Electronema sp. JC]|uniref:prepilin-type N-terminal cleavage/methylation domain-containing protein n=1 Tax=Candidatus Electronema sp. JC TaxID=3401570 RepID=UPI003AA88DCE
MKKTMTKFGFTLIEIMVSMVISSLVIAGVYGVYTIQQRSYTTQEQVTEMQQRLRSAVDFMSRDIRMAGYALDNTCSISQELLTVASDRFSFQYCERSGATWVTNRVTYSLTDAGELRRELHQSGSLTPLTRTIAEGIDGIEFQYLAGDGLTDSSGNVGGIRVVGLSILARAAYPDRKYTDNITYSPASGDSTWSGRFSPNPANDNFHRRLLVTSIELRNVGL